MKKLKTPKIKLPKLKLQQKKKVPLVLGIIAVVAITGFTIKHIYKTKMEQAYEVADQILGEGEFRGNPYVKAEYQNFKKNFDAVADKKYFSKAMVSTVDEFTAVSHNNALYADEQVQKVKDEQKKLEKEKEEQEKAKNKPVPTDPEEAKKQAKKEAKKAKEKAKKEKKQKKAEEKNALQLMQDREGRDHDFEQVAAVLPSAVKILVQEDYISGDLYNSFANFYSTYSTYVMDKYSTVPQEEITARYKYDFATKIRNIVESLEEFNKNAGEFYQLESEAICIPAQVVSLYEQIFYMSKDGKDGATLALLIEDMKDFPYTKDKVPVIGTDTIQEFHADAVKLATLQNGIGGYYDNPEHRRELQEIRTMPYRPEGIHGDFYYTRSGEKSFAVYRGTVLTDQKIDKAVENHLPYALEMADGSFMFVGKNKVQFTSNIDIPFLEGDFAEEEQQLAKFYANGGLPKAPAQSEKQPTKPAKQPQQPQQSQQPQPTEKHDVRSVQQSSTKYHGQVVGKLDRPKS